MRIVPALSTSCFTSRNFVISALGGTKADNPERVRVEEACTRRRSKFSSSFSLAQEHIAGIPYSVCKCLGILDQFFYALEEFCRVYAINYSVIKD